MSDMTYARVLMQNLCKICPHPEKALSYSKNISSIIYSNFEFHIKTIIFFENLDVILKAWLILIHEYFKFKHELPCYSFFNLSSFDCDLKNLRSCVHFRKQNGDSLKTWLNQKFCTVERCFLSIRASLQRVSFYLKWWWGWHQSNMVSRQFLVGTLQLLNKT